MAEEHVHGYMFLLAEKGCDWERGSGNCDWLRNMYMGTCFYLLKRYAIGRGVAVSWVFDWLRNMYTGTCSPVRWEGGCSTTDDRHMLVCTCSEGKPGVDWREASGGERY